MNTKKLFKSTLVAAVATASALALTTSAQAALIAGQTLGIDFGDGIWADPTPTSTDPALNGSGSETNFAVLVQQRDVGGTINRAPGGVNVTGQAISTDVAGSTLTGVTFSISSWTGFLASTDQVGYNAAGVGNYTGTPYSDLSFNDGIFGNGAGVITISGLNPSLTYDLSIASNMFANAAYGATVTDPVSAIFGDYSGTSIINGGTAAGPNPNPITPFMLTGLQTNGAGTLTLNFTENPTIISALTLTAVPEPSAFALFGLGGLGLILRRRRK